MARPGTATCLLTLALAVAVGVRGTVLLFEEKLIFFPQRRLELTPADLALRFEECWLRADDGTRSYGWFLPVPNARFSVIVCHGNAGNISTRLDRASLMMTKLQTEILLFDYRGYGRSEGTPSEGGTYRDGRAAYEYLISERRVNPERIIVFGESLGAAVAIQLALEVAVKALVIESAFTSIPDMARAIYPWLPVRSLLRTRYDNLGKIGKVRRPLFVLHGTRDETVPFEQGKRLFEAAPEPKRFFAVSGAGHNDTFLVGRETYWSVWKEFLDGLI